MAKRNRKKAAGAEDRAATKRFFTIAAVVTVGLLVLLYLIYALS